LAGALSQHNYLNEYVGFINEEEDRLIQTAYELLREDLKSERWSPKSSEAILLLVSMYTGLYDTPFTEDFLRFDIGSWPASLVNVAQKTLFDIKEELDVSSTIPSLTHISNAVSKEVQAHYEQNPYPRWTKVRASALENLASFVLHSCPTAQQLPEAFYNKSTPILIAGSGTGMQPITTALWFPSVLSWGFIGAALIIRAILLCGVLWRAPSHARPNTRMVSIDRLIRARRDR